jgi:serine/threonine protein kinase
MEQIPEIEVDYSNLSGYRIGDYICAKKLGQGSFACVYKGFHQKNQDDIVAIKVTNKDNYKGKDPEKYLKLLDAEAKAMTVCHS